MVGHAEGLHERLVVDVPAGPGRWVAELGQLQVAFGALAQMSYRHVQHRRRLGREVVEFAVRVLPPISPAGRES
jgi:hypothetical protein